MTTKKKEPNTSASQVFLILCSIVVGIVFLTYISPIVAQIVDIAWKCTLLSVILWIAKRV